MGAAARSRAGLSFPEARGRRKADWLSSP
jgi:hypothetical protein